MVKSPLRHIASYAQDSALWRPYGSLLAPIFAKDKMVGRGMQDYAVSVFARGIVRSNNNRGKCRYNTVKTESTWVDCGNGFELMSSAASVPSLNPELKEEHYGKFIADKNDLYDVIYQPPFVTQFVNLPGRYVVSTSENLVENRSLVDIDVMRCTKSYCPGCAVPVMDTAWQKGLNADLWTKNGQLYNKVTGQFETYTNDQLANRGANDVEGYSPRGDFQFMEAMKLDRTPAVPATAFKSLFLKKGTSPLPQAVSQTQVFDGIEYYDFALESIADKLVAVPGTSFDADALAKTKLYRPASRFLFNTNDTEIMDQINYLRTNRGADPLGVCPVNGECSNMCTDIMDTIRFELLDGRSGPGSQWTDMYPPAGKLDVDGLDKSAFDIYAVATWLAPAAPGPSYMEDCVSSQCCNGDF
jgi:hypothetical protein